MFFKNYSGIFVGIIFLAKIYESYQLKCFSCTLVHDTGAVKKFPSNFIPEVSLADCGFYNGSALIECPLQSKSCYTVAQQVEGIDYATFHMCGEDETLCNDINSQQDYKCKSCTSDGCNKYEGELIQCFNCYDPLPEVANAKQVAPPDPSQTQCGEFSNEELITCPPNYNNCLQVQMTALSSREKYTYRLCGRENECDGLSTANPGYSMTCSKCKTNGCNRKVKEGNLKCYSCIEGLPGTLPSLPDIENFPDRLCTGFGENDLITCPVSSRACYKLESSESSSLALHMCGINEEKCSSIDGTDYAGIKGISCHSCNENGCNTGSSFTVTRTIVVFFSIILMNNWFRRSSLPTHM